MRNIRIGFSKSKKTIRIGSKLIRWWLGAPFSHTYLYFQIDGLTRHSVFQAVGSGLELISIDKFLEHNEIVEEFTIPINDDSYFDILNKCHNAAGEDYGFWQNIGDLIATLFRLKHNPFTDGYNCSEWVALCLIELDPEAFSTIEDLNLVTPKDVYDYLEKKYGKTETN